MGNRIHKAIWEGDLAAVKEEMRRLESAKSLREGYDINIVGSYRTCENVTALRCAIERNNLEIVRFLLSRGANPNKRSPLPDVESDLFFAVRTSYRPAPEFAGGSLPFYYNDRYEIIRLLIAHGADVNFRERGVSVLGRAFESIMQGGISEESYKLLTNVLQLLVEKGADVEWERDHLRKSIEAGYAMLGNPKLAADHVDIKLKVKNYERALKALTPKAAVAAPVAAAKKTPTHRNNNVSSVRAVAGNEEPAAAGAGASPKVLYARPYSSNRVMTARPYTPVAAHPPPAPPAAARPPAPAAVLPPPVPATAAPLRPRSGAVVVLNEEEPAVNKTVGSKRAGDWPLWLAIENGNIQKVKDLIAAGANVNKTHTRNGDTPLTFAASEGHLEIVDLLIKAGAFVNTPNALTGETPLFIAASKGHQDIVQLLLEAGANVNAVVEINKNNAPKKVKILKLAMEGAFTEPINLLIQAFGKPRVTFSANTKKRRKTRRRR